MKHIPAADRRADQNTGEAVLCQEWKLPGVEARTAAVEGVEFDAEAGREAKFEHRTNDVIAVPKVRELRADKLRRVFQGDATLYADADVLGREEGCSGQEQREEANHPLIVVRITGQSGESTSRPKPLLRVILHLLWRPGRAADPVAEQQLQFTRMMAYAQKRTRFYQEWSGAKSLEELPQVQLLDYLLHPERFEVASAPVSPRQELEYPVGKAPRTAVLGQEIRGSWRVRSFSSYRSGKLAQFAPQSLAAPADTIRALAQSIEEGEIEWRPLTQSLIVFTDVVRGSLSQDDRDYFWRTFQVPIFEQFRGFAGELLAQECEAHNGMHVNPENAIFAVGRDGQLEVSFLRNSRAPLFRLATNLGARLLDGRCACGHLSPRLMDIRRRPAVSASQRRLVVVNS